MREEQAGDRHVGAFDHNDGTSRLKHHEKKRMEQQMSFSFSEFKPDWNKENPSYISARLKQKCKELEGARLLLGAMQSYVNDMEMEIADMTDRLIKAAETKDDD